METVSVTVDNGGRISLSELMKVMTKSIRYNCFIAIGCCMLITHVDFRNIIECLENLTKFSICYWVSCNDTCSYV